MIAVTQQIKSSSQKIYKVTGMIRGRSLLALESPLKNICQITTVTKTLSYKAFKMNFTRIVWTCVLPNGERMKT